MKFIDNNGNTIHYDIIATLSSGIYPTRSGYYITTDYGDGRVDVEYFDGDAKWQLMDVAISILEEGAE